MMKVDADVVDWFKARGEGYENLINAALRSFVERNKEEHRWPERPLTQVSREACSAVLMALSVPFTARVNVSVVGLEQVGMPAAIVNAVVDAMWRLWGS